jgi:hypothetical protein
MKAALHSSAAFFSIYPLLLFRAKARGAADPDPRRDTLWHRSMPPPGGPLLWE